MCFTFFLSLVIVFFWFGTVLPISFLCACPSSSQTPYRSLSVQARKVRSFRCSSSPQKVSRLFGDPLVRGVAVLALLRSSHSHICLGNGYSVVEVHGGSLEAPLTFPLPNFFRIFPLLFKIFSFELVNYKKPSLCRAFSKFPSLGRQREGQKINPLEKFFCFGSKLEPFSYAGLLVAPKWSHFSSMASKLMPCPFRISSVWLQN